MTAASRKANRLIHEKSPYLQQHAYNPVDWYPWGPEAFEKARQENKPILVSIGYSTCHWCHVMERESYEDPTVAELMNQQAVNIKVDREERPDVDKIYMTAVTAMTGSGGWPLNVFLTPDLKPFFGGTYFPPTARWGQPAWRDVVQQVGDAWREEGQRARIQQVGDQVTNALKQYTSTTAPAVGANPQWIATAVRDLASTFDDSRGGFGPAPKFPMPVYHNLLLRAQGRLKDAEALQMSLHTLREMAKGGIYDHLGGGFARYSTDADWHVPHFEKMLYDNAQLAVNYLEAYQVSGDVELARVAREIFAYILRDMTHPEGGFYSAEDADSLPEPEATEKREGAFYVWEHREIAEALDPKSAELFAFCYGVRENGNAAHDPHGEFIKKNILYKAHPLPEAARAVGVSLQDAEERLAKAKATLLEHRSKRPRPHLDDKVLSGWNGLMISGFAKGFQVFRDRSLLKAAQRAASFLRNSLYEGESKLLYRRWREGERQVEAIADDYAFLTQGLLDLYEADLDPTWLEWALELTEVMRERFWDAAGDGFFLTVAGRDDLIVRVKDDQDNVEPSSNSVAALNLARLGQYFDRADLTALALRTIEAYGSTLQQTPRALPQLLVALDFTSAEPFQVVITGNPMSPESEGLWAEVGRRFLPNKIVMAADGGPIQKRLSGFQPFIQDMRPVDNHATAYLCVRHACQSPARSLAEFQEQLGKL